MKHTNLPFSVLKHPVNFLALGFGSGLAPKAPGTFGTLMAIPLYLLMQPLALSFYLMITIAVCIAGVYICDKSARLLNVHDHPAIVWDEFAGYLITMIAAPAGWFWVVLGFGLFRFFDIVKPWPIKWLDKSVAGGFGIMIDDVLAGVFAAVVLQIIFQVSYYV